MDTEAFFIKLLSNIESSLEEITELRDVVKAVVSAIDKLLLALFSFFINNTSAA